MTSDVNVHLKSVQKAGDTTDVNESDFSGRLSVSPDGRFMLRFESSEEGRSTKTVIKSMDSSHVTVTRSGLVTTKMEFDADAPTPFIYHTPFGSFEFMLKTFDISRFVGVEPSLELSLNYALFNMGDRVSENSIELMAR
ncbi:MAG: DUF1934 domain-containing protein [Lachnospiraceae bacterium]|uniref:DUF1934 domain-containing protein n=1 Tax=Candidatus Weimeria bifida TaxID=2599074 RepID=A0A6N7J2L1_9FIRM|nr:DUF1934 domain-containing protein [Candidatus Weimeria bifida]RRF97335.1 MAG: DUF1934 domain-containing protein [Lachnospiraceae bacterium]